MSKNILITNDDGINSPGLKVAVSAVSGLGNITIAAPLDQQTGMGRSLYGDKENYFKEKILKIDDVKYSALFCDCSPALIVQHCINTRFVDELPDLIISGINYGANLGTNITQSGTIGAALEGGSYGIPSIAISLETGIELFKSYSELDWNGAKYFLNYFAKKILNEDLKNVEVLKIDIPSDATKDTEWVMTYQSDSPYYRSVIKNPKDCSKIKDAELKIQYNEKGLKKGSDIFTIIKDRLVSVTPLTLNLTAKNKYKELENRFS